MKKTGAHGVQERTSKDAGLMAGKNLLRGNARGRLLARLCLVAFGSAAIVCSGASLACSPTDRFLSLFRHEVINKFANLVQSRFAHDMVPIFVGTGVAPPKFSWRELRLWMSSARGFRPALYRQGYDINVPGIQNPDPGPWH